VNLTKERKKEERKKGKKEASVVYRVCRKKENMCSVECCVRNCRSFAKPIFLVLQILLIALSVLSLSETFTRPNYRAVTMAASRGISGCVMNKYICKNPLIDFPFQFGMASCTFSCPFSKHQIKFRGAMACVTLVVAVVGIGLRYLEMTKDPRCRGCRPSAQNYQIFFYLLAPFWFGVLVLDCHDTNKGYNFCKANFMIHYKQLNRSIQCIASEPAGLPVNSCSVGSFAGVCVIDFVAVVLLFLIYKFRNMLDESDAPAKRLVANDGFYRPSETVVEQPPKAEDRAFAALA
jgi:hypothetical protein